jgi:hypothetical protein
MRNEIRNGSPNLFRLPSQRLRQTPLKLQKRDVAA